MRFSPILDESWMGSTIRALIPSNSTGYREAIHHARGQQGLAYRRFFFNSARQIVLASSQPALYIVIEISRTFYDNVHFDVTLPTFPGLRTLYIMFNREMGRDQTSGNARSNF